MKLLNYEHCFDHIYDIDINYLKNNNIKGVIADADNTLLPWNGSDVCERTLAWLDGLVRHNIPVCILSNAKKRRVEEIAGKIGVCFVTRALKPLPFGYIKACRKLGLDKKDCLFIGDQLFTDILGARIARIKSALVEPVSRHEFAWTKFIRNFERLVGRKFKW